MQATEINTFRTATPETETETARPLSALPVAPIKALLAIKTLDRSRHSLDVVHARQIGADRWTLERTNGHVLGAIEVIAATDGLPDRVAISTDRALAWVRSKGVFQLTWGEPMCQFPDTSQILRAEPRAWDLGKGACPIGVNPAYLGAVSDFFAVLKISSVRVDPIVESLAPIHMYGRTSDGDPAQFVLMPMRLD